MNVGSGWGLCIFCQKERRLMGGGILIVHNRFDEVEAKMVRCEGSGKKPSA